MADLMAELAEVFELFAHSTPDEWMNDGPHLFTDTRQQVCCGRGHNECCGNPDVEGSVEEIGSVIDECDAPLIAACVNFLRTHHAEIAAAVSRDDILRELVESWRALERISGNKFERGVFKLCADQVVAAMAQEGAG